MNKKSNIVIVEDLEEASDKEEKVSHDFMKREEGEEEDMESVDLSEISA